MRSDWVGADMGAIYSIALRPWLLFYIDNMVSGVPYESHSTALHDRAPRAPEHARRNELRGWTEMAQTVDPDRPIYEQGL